MAPTELERMRRRAHRTLSSRYHHVCELVDGAASCLDISEALQSEESEARGLAPSTGASIVNQVGLEDIKRTAWEALVGTACFAESALLVGRLIDVAETTQSVMAALASLGGHEAREGARRSAAVRTPREV